MNKVILLILEISIMQLKLWSKVVKKIMLIIDQA